MKLINAVFSKETAINMNTQAPPHKYVKQGDENLAAGFSQVVGRTFRWTPCLSANAQMNGPTNNTAICRIAPSTPISNGLHPAPPPERAGVVFHNIEPDGTETLGQKKKKCRILAVVLGLE